MKHLVIAFLAIAFLGLSVSAQSVPDAAPTFTNTSHNGSVTLPRGTPITLVSLDPVSSRTATRGSPVRFAVADDLVVDGVVAIPSGEPLTGTVAKATRMEYENQPGHLKIRITPIRIGNQTVLLSTSDSSTRQGPLQASGDSIKFTGYCLIHLPFCIAMELFIQADERQAKADMKQSGDAYLPSCVHLQFWTRSAASIPRSQAPSVNTTQQLDLQHACPDRGIKPATLSASYNPDVRFK
ncbi:MAG TPA: hypothetical protein VGI45_21515 [Terracidiphilus sp.]|jgi:hypothetical protein